MFHVNINFTLVRMIPNRADKMNFGLARVLYKVLEILWPPMTFIGFEPKACKLQAQCLIILYLDCL